MVILINRYEEIQQPEEANASFLLFSGAIIQTTIILDPGAIIQTTIILDPGAIIQTTIIYF